jgi:hypothetical protein
MVDGWVGCSPTAAVCDRVDLLFDHLVDSCNIQNWSIFAEEGEGPGTEDLDCIALLGAIRLGREGRHD